MLPETRKHSSAIARMEAMPIRPNGKVPDGDVIPLDRGEPHFGTPQLIKDAMAQALDEGYTHYGDLNGDPELRELLAAVVSGTAGEQYDPEQVLVTHGATAALTTAVIGLLDPGDRVILPEPTYSAFPDLLAMVGAVPRYVPMTPDGRLDLAAIAEEAPHARMLMLCHPGNPTGVVHTAEELTALAEVLDRHDRHGITVVADEVYADIVYDARPFTSTLAVPGLRPRLLYCQSLSKSFAMSGWRVGYLVMPTELAPPIRRLHRVFNGSVNAAAQRASLAALRAGPGLSEPMVRAYQEARDTVADWLTSSCVLEGPPPQAGLFLLGRYDHPLPSVDVARHLLAHGVAVRPGLHFGPSGEHHLRLSFSLDRDRLEAGLLRLEKGLGSLGSTPSA